MVAVEFFGQLHVTVAEELLGQLMVAEELFGQLTVAEELFGQLTVAEELFGQLMVAGELAMVASTGRQLWPLKIYKKKLLQNIKTQKRHLTEPTFVSNFISFLP